MIIGENIDDILGASIGQCFQMKSVLFVTAANKQSR